MTSRHRVERPIFIVGPGRSGTTLLRSLLSAHSAIAIAPETHFMNRASKRGGPSGGPADFDEFWREYTAWVRFTDLDIDPVQCRAMIDEEGEYTFESVFRCVLAAFRERVGKRWVGEKSPSHINYLPELLRWFPDARILILQRDPRAVVASQLKTPYVQRQIVPLSLRNGLFRRKRATQAIFYARDWQEIYGNVVQRVEDDPRVRVVPYESLVTNAEDELRDICGFLEEPFEPTMLTDRTPDTVPQPAGVTPSPSLEQWRRSHYANALAPVSTDSIRKWAKELTWPELAMVEGHCAPLMQKLGYEPTLSHRTRMAGRALVAGLSGAAAAEQAAIQVIGRLRRLVRTA